MPTKPQDAAQLRMPTVKPLPIQTKGVAYPTALWRWIRTIRRWKLIEDWEHRLPDQTRIVIPKGFQFDGASIPRIFWGILAPTGLLLIPGLVHDFAYRYDCLLRHPRNGGTVGGVQEGRRPSLLGRPLSRCCHQRKRFQNHQPRRLVSTPCRWVVGLGQEEKGSFGALLAGISGEGRKRSGSLCMMAHSTQGKCRAGLGGRLVQTCGLRFTRTVSSPYKPGPEGSRPSRLVSPFQPASLSTTEIYQVAVSVEDYSSPLFSPGGEAKCVRGRSARGGVLEQYVEHGEQAQRRNGGPIRVLRPSAGEKCGLGWTG